MRGLQSKGPAGKGTCSQAGQCEFESQDLHDKRNEMTPESWLLASTHIMAS